MKKDRTDRKQKNLKMLILCLLTLFCVTGLIPAVQAPVSVMAAENSYLWPVPGSRNLSQGYSVSHDGLDITGAEGSAIVASKSGTVAKVLHGDEKNWYGYGNGVVISHGDGYYTHYAHMSYVSVSEGQAVSQGQQIGGMGQTGNATGTHLHFAIATSQYGAGGRINNNVGSVNYI